jgi:hypothetical protein
MSSSSFQPPRAVEAVTANPMRRWCPSLTASSARATGLALPVNSEVAQRIRYGRVTAVQLRPASDQ